VFVCNSVYYSTKAGLCDSCCLSVTRSVSRLSFCKQDNSQTRLCTSTKRGRHGQGATLYKWLNFGVDSNLGVAVRSIFHFLQHYGDRALYDILLLDTLLPDDAAALAESAL